MTQPTTPPPVTAANPAPGSGTTQKRSSGVPVILRDALRSQSRLLIGWAIALVLLYLMIGGVWQLFQNTVEDLESFMENYPQELLEVFGVTDFTTDVGFMQAEMYSIIVPFIAVIVGAVLGARALAGDEEQGRLEPVVAAPVSRTRVVAERSLAALLGVSALMVVAFLSLGLSALVFSMDIPLVQNAAVNWSLAWLGMLYAAVALAVGALTGRKSIALGVATAAAIFGYVVYAFLPLVEELEGWSKISPWYWALNGDPLFEGFDWVGTALLAGSTALLVAITHLAFDRRDLHSPT